MSRKKKIGFALGGGGARGIAHIGVMTALAEAGIRPDVIAGTSVGALIAAFYAFGIDLEKQKKLAQNMRWRKITKIKLPRFGLVSNLNLKKFIIQTIGRDQQIQRANIPLAIITTNIETGEKVVLKKGDLAEAIMASSAIPGIFSPVTINNQMLVDGGLTENVPISPLKQMDADIIIAIDLMKKPLPRKPKNITEVISNSFYIMLEQSRKTGNNNADVLIQPKLPTYIKTDSSSLTKMYSQGYKEGKKYIKNILKILNK